MLAPCCRVADPLRHLGDGLASLANPLGTVTDKVRVGLIRARTVLSSNEAILTAPEMTTEQALKVRRLLEYSGILRPVVGWTEWFVGNALSRTVAI